MLTIVFFSQKITGAHPSQPLATPLSQYIVYFVFVAHYDSMIFFKICSEGADLPHLIRVALEDLEKSREKNGQRKP